MFSRNWIASLLVVVYGLTAGIGPFWHSHSGGCGCCLSTRAEGLSAARTSETGRGTVTGTATGTVSEAASSSSACTSGCAFCARRSAANKTEKTSARAGSDTASDESSSALELGRFGEDAEHDNDFCVVCDFYGKTYFSTLGFEIVDRSQIVTNLPSFIDHAPSLQAPLAAARDPPIE